MSLRFRLFLVFGGLVGLLVVAEWWLVRTLTHDLSREVAATASTVGEEVLRIATGSGEVPGKERVLVRTFRLETGEQQATISETLPAPRIVTSSAGGHLVVSVQGPKIVHRIEVRSEGITGSVDRFRERLLLGSLGLFLAGLLAAALVADRVSAPLRELARAARDVGGGTLGAQVSSRAGGEVGEAIASFNQMSGRLAELERETLGLKEREHLSELGEVARGMAHALRNPLHAVGLSLDELASRLPEDPSALEIAESARGQIQRVDHSIRAFLALASDGSGAVEEVAFRPLVEEVVLTALQDARGRVNVEVLADESEGPPIAGIPAELKAVVQALVVNAVEASPDGATVKVRVGIPANGGASLEVEDEGPGLPAEVLERLFTPHVTTKPSGSGMGLFLAHRLAVTRYGGSLKLEPRHPHGTLALLTISGRVGTRRG